MGNWNKIKINSEVRTLAVHEGQEQKPTTYLIPGTLEKQATMVHMSHPEIFEFQDVIKIKNKATIFL